MVVRIAVVKVEPGCSKVEVLVMVARIVVVKVEPG